jgi:hypothetical protein
MTFRHLGFTFDQVMRNVVAWLAFGFMSFVAVTAFVTFARLS